MTNLKKKNMKSKILFVLYFQEFIFHGGETFYGIKCSFANKNA